MCYDWTQCINILRLLGVIVHLTNNGLKLQFAQWVNDRIFNNNNNKSCTWSSFLAHIPHWSCCNIPSIRLSIITCQRTNRVVCCLDILGSSHENALRFVIRYYSHDNIYGSNIYTVIINKIIMISIRISVVVLINSVRILDHSW